jgi:hypothetical protein
MLFAQCAPKGRRGMGLLAAASANGSESQDTIEAVFDWERRRPAGNALRNNIAAILHACDKKRISNIEQGMSNAEAIWQRG